MTLFMALSPQLYGLVYTHPPVRDLREGGWSRRGELFYFSPADTRRLGLRAHLRKDVAREVLVTAADTAAPLYFVREPDEVVYLTRAVYGGLWHIRQPFCERVFRALKLPPLVPGGRLSVVFP